MCQPFGFEPIPGADPNCLRCGGDGIVDNRDVLVFDQSYAEQCDCVQVGPTADEARYSDADEDGWLDGVARVPARYAGAQGALKGVDEIVLHDVGKGRHGAIPRYFATMADGRVASAHFVVHVPGWSRLLTQCVPLTRPAWHCPGVNFTSVGIEHDEPDAEEPHWPEETMATSFALVDSLLVIFPGIKRIVAHKARSPRSRVDPRHWPWDEWRQRYIPQGVAVASTPAELATIV